VGICVGVVLVLELLMMMLSRTRARGCPPARRKGGRGAGGNKETGWQGDRYTGVQWDGGGSWTREGRVGRGAGRSVAGRQGGREGSRAGDQDEGGAERPVGQGVRRGYLWCWWRWRLRAGGRSTRVTGT
jgi:hypothetical protein